MEQKSNYGGIILSVVVAVFMGCGFLSMLSSCATRNAKTYEAPVAQQESRESNADVQPAPNPTPIEPPQPTYSDPRWPTTNSELLAIPESSRWYTAKERVYTTGTIAGPVASVAPLDGRVMINIGNDYPNPNRAQIIIWSERVSEFADMLSEIDHGGAWVSFTGYISEYDGIPEINPNNGYTEWTWWTR
jgi:hypothetical protein